MNGYITRVDRELRDADTAIGNARRRTFVTHAALQIALESGDRASIEAAQAADCAAIQSVEIASEAVLVALALRRRAYGRNVAVPDVPDFPGWRMTNVQGHAS